jgi:hypothetical protein
MSFTHYKVEPAPLEVWQAQHNPKQGECLHELLLPFGGQATVVCESRFGTHTDLVWESLRMRAGENFDDAWEPMLVLR